MKSQLTNAVVWEKLIDAIHRNGNMSWENEGIIVRLRNALDIDMKQHLAIEDKIAQAQKEQETTISSDAYGQNSYGAEHLRRRGSNMSMGTQQLPVAQLMPHSNQQSPMLQSRMPITQQKVPHMPSHVPQQQGQQYGAMNNMAVGINNMASIVSPQMQPMVTPQTTIPPVIPAIHSAPEPSPTVNGKQKRGRPRGRGRAPGTTTSRPTSGAMPDEYLGMSVERWWVDNEDEIGKAGAKGSWFHATVTDVRNGQHRLYYQETSQEEWVDIRYLLDISEIRILNADSSVDGYTAQPSSRSKRSHDASIATDMHGPITDAEFRQRLMSRDVATLHKLKRRLQVSEHVTRKKLDVITKLEADERAYRDGSSQLASKPSFGRRKMMSLGAGGDVVEDATRHSTLPAPLGMARAARQAYAALKNAHGSMVQVRLGELNVQIAQSRSVLEKERQRLKSAEALIKTKISNIIQLDAKNKGTVQTVPYERSAFKSYIGRYGRRGAKSVSSLSKMRAQLDTRAKLLAEKLRTIAALQSMEVAAK